MSPPPARLTLEKLRNIATAWRVHRGRCYRWTGRVFSQAPLTVHRLTTHANSIRVHSHRLTTHANSIRVHSHRLTMRAISIRVHSHQLTTHASSIRSSGFRSRGGGGARGTTSAAPCGDGNRGGPGRTSTGLRRSPGGRRRRRRGGGGPSPGGRSLPPT